MLSVTRAGQIRLTRGDTLDIPFELNAGTSMDPIRYQMRASDELYFGLMEPNQPWEFAILKKKYTGVDFIDGVINIHLDPEDSMCLIPGLYYYQMKVRIKKSDDSYIVNTVIPKTQFYIEE